MRKPGPHGSVILFDNVTTTGGTMEGAMRTVRRDTRAEPIGFAALWSAAEGLAEAG